MRNISILPHTPQRTERVSETSASKLVRSDEKFKRVRDVKQANKRERKNPRIFNVRRKQMSPHNERNFAKLVNFYQRDAVLDWNGFIRRLPSVDSLSDAEIFVLQSMQQSSHLYPASVLKSFHQYNSIIARLSETIEPNSRTLQQLVTYENYLEGLLSMLVLCRSYDQSIKSDRVL